MKSYKKINRFLITGIFVTAVHVVIAVILINKMTLNPPLANGAAFIFATVTSCIINTRWSFSSKLSHHVMIKFSIVSIIGLLVSVSVAWIAQELGVGYLFGIFFVAIISPAITFILHNFWTYKNSQLTN